MRRIIQTPFVVTSVVFAVSLPLYGQQADEDPYAKAGNAPPKIVQLSAEEEATILKDVTVPPEFDVTLFSPAATANYPVYVAAAPNGDLYVSSDGNGSLGRDPHRGRVLRLRDEDGDGRADQVTQFVPDIDSPRGLIWDHDRLYLLHPPHISVFLDRDGDGVAEDSKVLIRDIAFGFADRPADHTTNGLELGIDGWIYIAGGDFGFMNAVGADGRQLQHRGGGVIRFRPDGSGLELFATGTRNILGTPTSPLLDIFARDNTNDGGGWDIRFHHFTGLEDHGYPRLYMNFDDEHIHPLADYGGGSGCGSVYIHEPGFPAAWGPGPYTCDWGRAATFRHTVERRQATFAELEPPKPFIKMTRPTDADVDGMSRVYQASWKGPATFNWKGPDVGYIVRVSPKHFTPDPLPDFLASTEEELIALLDSASHIRTLNAQRALVRREWNPITTGRVAGLANDPARNLRARVAALYAVVLKTLEDKRIEPLIAMLGTFAEDAALRPFVLRAAGDLPVSSSLPARSQATLTTLLSAGAENDDPRTRVEAMVSAARLNLVEAGTALAENLGHSDAVIAHTAFQALAALGASDACFDVLDSTGASDAQRRGAAHALMRMHRADVVENLIGRLQANTTDTSNAPILSALSRLYHREAPWKGASWGTRPDTRGPYYELETWSESEKILNALKDTLANASADEAAALVTEMNRNRIQSNEALERIVTLAAQDEKHITTAITQLAAIEEIPQQGIPIVIKAARSTEMPPTVLAQAITCLAKIPGKEAFGAIIPALLQLDEAQGAGKARQMARNAFLNHPRLGNHIQVLDQLAAETPATNQARWANAGILILASRKNTSPEVRSQADRALDLGWQDPERRILLMRTAAELRNHHLDARIQAALSDFDEDVANAAKAAARRLRIKTPGEDNSPAIASLTTEEAVKQAVATSGDQALGEAVFLRAACATCHTVSQDQVQKGPYLGTIANTYRRKDLAESILLPSKTIAQGFATNLLTLKDGTEITGFVTNEAGDRVTLRDIAGQEHVVLKANIHERITTTASMMPIGLMGAFTVKELASLLDYLEALAKD